MKKSRVQMSRLPSSFDVEDADVEELSFADKIVYHCKQQPLVPIGTLLTTGAVILAAQNMRIGNRKKTQFYFRWRVGLQAATLAALVAGSFIYGKDKYDQKKKEDQMKEKAKLREQLWIKELERRDAEAQDRKKKAEAARLKTKENEAAIQKLEQELKELEAKASK